MGWWEMFSNEHLPGGEEPSAEDLGACWRHCADPCLADNPTFCREASGQPSIEKTSVVLEASLLVFYLSLKQGRDLDLHPKASPGCRAMS